MLTIEVLEKYKKLPPGKTLENKLTLLENKVCILAKT